MTPLLYTPYVAFLQKHFDHKMQKLPIDAGCTCPVRDGHLSHGGCAFCNACSFVPPCSASAADIKEQVALVVIWPTFSQARILTPRPKKCYPYLMLH